MPLGRYFAFMDSALLALLFLADWYMPDLSAAPSRTEVDKSIIRIHTMHKWPEAIVFDTSLPTIIPPPVIAAELPAKRPPRDALALLPQPAPSAAAAAAVEPKPAATKRRSRTARVSTGRIASYRGPGSADLFVAGW
jgi:hypothetical protein